MISKKLFKILNDDEQLICYKKQNYFYSKYRYEENSSAWRIR